MTSKYCENWDDDVPSIDTIQKYWRYTLLNKRMYGGVYYAPIDENNAQEMKRLNEFLDSFNEQKPCIVTPNKQNKQTEDKKRENNNDNYDKNHKHRDNNMFRDNNRQNRDNRQKRRREPYNDVNKRNNNHVLGNLSSSSDKVDTFNRFTATSLIKSNIKR